MAEIIRLGHPAIDVELRRSARARRLSLRISNVDGRVSLTLPARARMSEAERFLDAQEAWLRDHLAQRPDPVVVRPGLDLPVEGQMRRIVEASGRTVRLTDEQLLVPVGTDKAGVRAGAFLKTLARDRLAEASTRYAAKLGRNFGRITLRDTRSRWGSCSSDGNLMYSWRLILAPPDVLDYVAAHEVAHLAEMNHSKRYWDGLEGLLPTYKAPRAWLRQNGLSLHRYKF
ncbi:MAG: M48 family metallopeptidase [Paracoccaceae bacterium]